MNILVTIKCEEKKLSDAGRAKIAAAARKRWAKVRKQNSWRDLQ
jgi:hypothetical protein